MTQRENRKITGNYRCIDNVRHFIVRINLREILNENIVENAEKTEVETQDFRWQEKKFGKSEKDFYRDVKNCVTDLDKKYHDELRKNTDDNKVLYSYINEDPFCLHEEDVCNSKYTSDLCKHMTTLRFIDFDHTESTVNPFIENNYVAMYIMADFGEYVEDTWIKHEYILCTIKYIPQKNLLSIFPDFTVFEPYRLTVDGDTMKIYEYTIENASDIINAEVFETEHEILNKIATYRRKSTGRTEFTIPPNDKLHYFVFLEISKGRNFEYDDVYVRYFVDLPENWSCFDGNRLRGATQTCRGRTLSFGATFDVGLSFDLSKLPSADTPYVYFEVISKDTFDRYRTEGVAYVKLPASPGTHVKWLQCLRILPGKVSTKLRRVFIGDYMSYEDVTWFASPKEHKDGVLNKQGVTTVETGEIEVRFNVVIQSRVFVGDEKRREKFILEKLGSAALIESVEQVLEAFGKARKNMLEAREKAA